MFGRIMLVIFLILPWCSPSAFGDDVKAIDVTNVVDGRYMLTIAGDSIGIVPLNLLSAGPVPPPQPPSPDQLTARAKAIKTAAEKLNDAEMCQKMGLLFDEIAKLIDEGKLKGQANIAAMMSKGQGMVLGKSINAWKPVTSIISAEFATLIQDGSTDAEFASYIREIRDGLRAAAPEQMIDPMWIQLILQIIQMILALIG